jgi:hypothetical protein
LKPAISDLVRSHQRRPGILQVVALETRMLRSVYNDKELHGFT